MASFISVARAASVLRSRIPELRGMPYANYWLGDTANGLKLEVEPDVSPYCRIRWEYRDDRFHLHQFRKVLRSEKDLEAAVAEVAASVPKAVVQDARNTPLAPPEETKVIRLDPTKVLLQHPILDKLGRLIPSSEE